MPKFLLHFGHMSVPGNSDDDQLSRGSGYACFSKTAYQCLSCLGEYSLSDEQQGSCLQVKPLGVLLTIKLKSASILTR